MPFSRLISYFFILLDPTRPPRCRRPETRGSGWLCLGSAPGDAKTQAQLVSFIQIINFLEFQLTNKEPGRVGNDHHKYYPHGIYKCEGSDSWIAITIENIDEWKALCTVIGAHDFLQNNRLNSVDARINTRREIDDKIEGWTSIKNNTEAMITLQNVGAILLK